MSFIPSNFSLLTDSIGGKTCRVYAYLSSDTLAAVAGSGYFAGVGLGFGVKVGDILLVVSLSGAFKTTNMTFTAIGPSTGNATAALDDVVTTALNFVPSHIPASATDTGTTGDFSRDAGYLYMCVATNTWVRAALSSW